MAFQRRSIFEKVSNLSVVNLVITFLVICLSSFICSILVSLNRLKNLVIFGMTCNPLFKRLDFVLMGDIKDSEFEQGMNKNKCRAIFDENRSLSS